MSSYPDSTEAGREATPNLCQNSDKGDPRYTIRQGDEPGYFPWHVYDGDERLVRFDLPEMAEEFVSMMEEDVGTAFSSLAGEGCSVLKFKRCIDGNMIYCFPSAEVGHLGVGI